LLTSLKYCNKYSTPPQQANFRLYFLLTQQWKFLITVEFKQLTMNYTIFLSLVTKFRKDTALSSDFAFVCKVTLTKTKQANSNIRKKKFL